VRRGDDGVTLIELLVCIAITGVVMSALAMSFIASTRSIKGSSARMANTHDSQMATSFFSSDMQSANLVAPGPGILPCGTGSPPLVTFTWFGTGSTLPPTELTKVATYRVVTQNGSRRLVRQFCTGPGLNVNPSPTTVVIAHNLNGTTPKVACFNSGNSTVEVACSGQGVIVAQLTARAQSDSADDTGFDYVLRATRRPT